MNKIKFWYIKVFHLYIKTQRPLSIDILDIDT